MKACLQQKAAGKGDDLAKIRWREQLFGEARGARPLIFGLCPPASSVRYHENFTTACAGLQRRDSALPGQCSKTVHSGTANSA
ncbi:hypothetical protein SAMN05444159_4586 [Bradyrhizobium lablabi]|uniref:Uncharacterized protein n=1 Tax=Bradyrhizobium lablabi TaxID=722472 RepID=A0A1M6WJW2_9BRAD|nr:hypothetical protein SAMN05444159_4586 [Bradyrhizobium lablabi]